MKQEDYNKCLDNMIRFDNSSDYYYDLFAKDILNALKYIFVPEERTYMRLYNICQTYCFSMNNIDINKANLIYKKAIEIFKISYSNFDMDLSNLPEKIDENFSITSFVIDNIKMRNKDLLLDLMMST